MVFRSIFLLPSPCPTVRPFGQWSGSSVSTRHHLFMPQHKRGRGIAAVRLECLQSIEVSLAFRFFVSRRQRNLVTRPVAVAAEPEKVRRQIVDGPSRGILHGGPGDESTPTREPTKTELFSNRIPASAPSLVLQLIVRPALYNPRAPSNTQVLTPNSAYTVSQPRWQSRPCHPRNRALALY